MSDRRLYVYYRLGTDAAAAARPAVEAAQATLRAGVAGLQAELLRRPEANAAGEWTWMETYRCDGGISAPLRAAIEATMSTALAPWLPAGARHVEVFETLRDEPMSCA